jgi:flagellar basal-body rod modification protein FlgD
MTISTSYATTTPAATASTTAASTTAASTAASSTATGTNTLATLTGNFNDFLSLLTTQLKNQDPTSPMDTNQFTSQLVQFTAVAQQIQTNTTLGQLLTASLAQQLGQASSLIGKDVSVSGGTLPLQNGAATVTFQTPGAESVQLAVSDANGNVVRSTTVNATAGANTWTWDGTNSAGTQLADGGYTVAVTAAGAAVPFQAVGTVTGAQQANQAVQLMFGNAGVPFNQVVSLTAGSATAAAK